MPVARHRRTGRARILACLLIALPLLAARPTAAATTDFPAGWTGYHTYSETVADVAAVETAHPNLVKRYAVGTSYQNRTIWAAKVSDNVTTDEAEPEVYFDGLTHADEHMGLEMTLRILHWLVDGYGSDARITNIVNNREIWIVFAVNPDGGEYDIAGGKFHYWRKNRQPNAGTTAIGTDLNRNYGYRWGAGGNTSTNPAAITYQGPFAFSAPETRVIRDFFASRVVGGVQQLRTAITFHEYGRLVMWPYGYTLTDVPADMTADDHSALVAIGRSMAATNGYKPEQASDLYLTSGTTRDYLYGMYRTFAYTFELSIRDYPDDALIASETGRNREAVLSLIERADCPLGVLGPAMRIARCGAFDDDLEVARGWTVNADGTDTATAGGWQRGDPAATSTAGGVKQLGNATSGISVLGTGLAAGTSASANDLDGGRSTILSPVIDLPAGLGQTLQFRWSFAHDASPGRGDGLTVEVVDVVSGTRRAVFRVLSNGTDSDGAWRAATISLDTFAGSRIRLRFVAADAAPDGLVEAEVDDIRVTRPL
jgi:hypothetical protein